MKTLFGEELASRGHAIDWLLQSEADCDKAYVTEWEGGRAFVGATANGARRLDRLWKHIIGLWNDARLFTLAKHNDYDFIQVKDKFISALMALLVTRKSRSQFIYWLSWPFPEESILTGRDGTARYPLFYILRGYLFRFLLYRIILPKADFIFVQSEQMKRDVAEEGIPAEKMLAVPMGVSLDDLPAPQQTGSAEGAPPTIAYLGTMIRVRRMDFLIRVFAKVKARVPEARLLMIGGGEDDIDMQILEEEAQKLGVENAVTFTGFIPKHEAWAKVAKVDVCVSPFFPTPILNSTSPTKLIEYMAIGKPVVANDHPEQRLVLEESGAGICVPYEEEAFAEAVTRLLQDRQLAVAMGGKGPGYVAMHRSYSRIADKVEEQYLALKDAG